MVRQEHVVVAHLHFLADFRQGAVVDFSIGSTCYIGERAVEPPRHGDVLRLHTHLDERGACLDGFPQVGVALVESVGVGPPGLGQHGVGNGRHRAVVGPPAAMSWIQIDTDFVGRLGLHCASCHDGGYGK